VTNELLERFTF